MTTHGQDGVEPGMAVLEVSCPVFSLPRVSQKHHTVGKDTLGLNKDVMLILLSLGNKQDRQSRYFCLSR